MIILITIVSFLHLKYKFSTLSLIGFSVWGIGHMLGGSTLLTKERLYVYVIYPLFTSGDTIIFKYDQLMHFYFYLVATIMIYEIFKNYVKKESNWFVLSIFLIFASIGVGAFNEIIEFMPVLFLGNTGVGGYYNTLWDIIFNTFGAIVAVIYLSFIRKH